MTNQPQLGRAAGADRFPNGPGTLTGFTAPTSKPDPRYTEESPGTGVGAAPGFGGAKQDTEGFEKPGVRSSATAVPSASTDRAGARLLPVTNSTADRARYLRQFLENEPRPYDPLAPRESFGRVVQPYQGDPVWGRRRASQAQQDQG